MSKLQFIDNPFPDNHNGFDYAPSSFMDEQDKAENEATARASVVQQRKMMSFLANVLE